MHTAGLDGCENMLCVLSAHEKSYLPIQYLSLLNIEWKVIFGIINYSNSGDKRTFIRPETVCIINHFEAKKETIKSLLDMILYDHV